MPHVGLPAKSRGAVVGAGARVARCGPGPGITGRVRRGGARRRRRRTRGGCRRGVCSVTGWSRDNARRRLVAAAGRPPGRGRPEPGEGCASTPDGRSEGSSSGCGAAGGGVVAARHLKESMPAGRTRWRRCGEIRRRAPPRTRPSGPGRAGRCAPPGPPPGTGSPTTCCAATPAAARPNRRWVVDFTRVPTRSGFCCTAFVTGPVRAGRIVGRGHRQPHGAPTTRPAPPGRRSGRARTAGAATSRAWCTTATTDPSHLSIAYTGRLVDEGTGRIGRSRGLLLRGRRRPGPGQAPASAGPVLARRPLEGPRRPPGPPPPDG